MILSDRLTIIAGPCAVESREQILAAAAVCSRLGIPILRGGTYKPRTSPRSFQGLGQIGLELLRDAGQAYHLQTITEVVDTRDIDLVCQHVDFLQVGARSMQNYELLKEAGRTGRSVLLKRGLAATLFEWFSAAEYVGEHVVLCERGHRTYMDHVRFMLDMAGIVEAKRAGFQVLADPSHAAGSAHLVPALALAAIAAGTDGLIIEMHPDPGSALSDGKQQLSPEELGRLIQTIQKAAKGPCHVSPDPV